MIKIKCPKCQVENEVEAPINLADLVECPFCHWIFYPSRQSIVEERWANAKSLYTTHHSEESSINDTPPPSIKTACTLLWIVAGLVVVICLLAQHLGVMIVSGVVFGGLALMNRIRGMGPLWLSVFFPLVLFLFGFSGMNLLFGRSASSWRQISYQEALYKERPELDGYSIADLKTYFSQAAEMDAQDLTNPRAQARLKYFTNLVEKRYKQVLDERTWIEVFADAAAIGCMNLLPGISTTDKPENSLEFRPAVGFAMLVCFGLYSWALVLVWTKPSRDWFRYLKEEPNKPNK